MAVNMNLLEGYSFDDPLDRLRELQGRRLGRRGRRERSRLQNLANRMGMANNEGTGLLQEDLAFEDIGALIDPQRRLSLDESTVDFDERRRKLFEAFDTIRARPGVTRSGFTDYAEQQALRDLARERKRTLFQAEGRFDEMRSGMESQNDQIIMRNRQRLFDVMGDDIYESIRSMRENR